MPRVSVITPAHDNAATIEATIASVAAQAYGDWELIVCDDASSDATPALVEAAAAADPRVRLVRAPRNLGPSGARNLALAASEAELVAFLDADDRYEPAFLDTLVARYDAEAPGVGIVCCDAWRVDAGGTRLDRYGEVIGRPEHVDLASLLKANTIILSASLCPRAAVVAAGGFSDECFGSEDHDLWLRIVEGGGRVVYVPEPLIAYRVAEGSVSSSRLRMARTDQATFRRALARGRLSPAERRIARARLDLAVAAEAVAEGAGPRALPKLARAAAARLTLRRA